MSQVIECPGCDKRFRLGDTPPATYTCKQCGTVMDLSDFGGAPAPAAAAAAASGAPATRSQRRKGATAGARSSSAGPTRAGPSRSRSGGGGRRRAPARGGSSRGRAADRYDDDYEDDRPRGRQKKSNAGMLLIFGALGLVVVALMIALLTKKGDKPGEETTADRPSDGVGVNHGTQGAGAGVVGGGGVGAGIGAGMGGTSPTPGTNAGGSNAGGSVGGEPSGDGATAPAAPVKSKKMGRRRLSRVNLQVFPYPDEVEEALRPKIEEAMVNLMRGDRSSAEAQSYLVGLGRRVGGRLVNEFKNIQDNETFESPSGRSKAGVLDATLRRMDGWIERRWQTEDILRVTSQPDKVLGFARRWTVWWMEDRWKTEPRDPWDPTVDRLEEDKPKVDKKKEAERKGWDKRNK